MAPPGPPGRPTMADVAARAGVSKATVSLALRGAPGPSAASVDRIRQAAAELGYRTHRAASTLALRRTRLLGITLAVRNTFHAELAEHLQEAAEDTGYQVLLGPVTRRGGERAAVDALVDSRCEALLLLGPELPPADLAALDAATPLVLLGRRVGGLDVVRTPDDAGVALAVDHLVALGHRDVAHVSGGSGSIAAERRAGFAAAVAAAGPGAQARVLEAEFSEEAGADAGRRLLDAGLPVTAVVAANDRVALGLLDVMARAGVDVPGRLSVVGYDDSPLARLGHVQLTSVSQDPAAQAREAVRLALERLDGGRGDDGGRAEPVDVLIPPRLVVRATTGPRAAPVQVRRPHNGESM